MLGPHSRVVKACRHRVRLDDLAVFVLQQIRAIAVQHTGAAADQRCRVATRFDAVAGRFDTDQLHGIVVDVRIKDTHRIRTTADTRDRNNRVTKPALVALGMTEGQTASRALVNIARNHPATGVRNDALFWLSQRAGDTLAVGAIAEAIEKDPDTSVRKQAMFALSQLPRDEGIPKLIDVAKNNRNSAVRQQAMFWLGQTNDPRAIKFFEDVLLK